MNRGKSYATFVADRAFGQMRFGPGNSIDIEDALPNNKADPFADFDVPFVATAEMAPGAPALLMRVTEIRGEQDRTIVMAPDGFVRIAGVQGPLVRTGSSQRVKGLYLTTLATVQNGPPRSSLPIARLKAALSDFIGRDPACRALFHGRIDYERLRLEGLDSHDAVGRWAAQELPLPLRRVLELAAMSESDRSAALLAHASGR